MSPADADEPADEVGIAVHFHDRRLARSPGARQGAHDDGAIRDVLTAAAQAGGVEHQIVSVARLHDEPPERTFRWPAKAFRRVDFVDCDLAGSRISGGLLRRVRLEACSFERVRLDPFDAAKVDAIDCRFDRVDFAGRAWAEIRDSTFTRCTFNRCDMRYLTFSGCRFNDVRFDRPRTTRTMFQSTSLSNANFSGRSGRLFFVDCDLSGVDFADAVPSHVYISGGSQRSVQFPRSHESFVVPREAFRDTATQIAEQLSPKGAKDLRMYAGIFGLTDPAPIFIGREILDSFGLADRDVVLDALYPHAIIKL